ncbi:MAG: hypothetical protein NTV36_03605 [Candidatus Staskawiczbacteria bacterium]|nr:hypothetical protein [Candidatus Staskawiczbacteria bacterium]
MRKMNVAMLVASFVLMVCCQAKAETIWSDSFESGSFNAWTSVNGNWITSGGNNHSGTKRAQIAGANTTGGDILVLEKPSTGYTNVALNYWCRIHDSLEANDYLFVEYTANGGDWHQLEVYNNVVGLTTWNEHNLLLPADAGNNQLFQFRLRANFNSASDVVYFDDFTLSGQPVPEPSSLLILFPCFAFLLVRRFK